MNLPSFDALRRNYPTGANPDAVRAAIGGSIATQLGPLSNTCVIRMSRAMNYAGKMYEIPKKGIPAARLYTLEGGDGKQYALRVAEFLKFMGFRFGRPTISKRYKRGEKESVTPFLNKRGIIAWHISGWFDATGHFTLWDGTRGLYTGGEDYFNDFPKYALLPNGKTRTIEETGADLWEC